MSSKIYFQDIEFPLFLFSLPKATEEQASNYMKLITIVFGIIVIVMVFVIEKMGAVFQASLSLFAIPAGSLLGIFTLGMTCKTVNTKVNYQKFLFC